jgi:hypothetical protein
MANFASVLRASGVKAAFVGSTIEQIVNRQNGL